MNDRVEKTLEEIQGLRYAGGLDDPIEAGRFDQLGTSLDKQVGGNHYKTLAIQPVEYIMKNSIPFMEGNVIKYVSRWRDKGGIEDLRKAKHYLEMLIEHEEKAK